MEDSFCVGVGDNAAEVGGGVVGDSSSEDDCFSVLLVEEVEHLLEREGAADIGVEYEESFWLALHDRVSEVVQASCCAQSLVFTEVADFELGEFSG